MIRSVAHALILAFVASVFGCSQTSTRNLPRFVFAWSEYPSWSVFGVAAQKGLIGTGANELGSVEQKWDVRIDLKEVDYEGCITAYNAGVCDAVCITNLDVLNSALGRKSVAILPTSTSVGADACIVVGIDTTDKKKALASLRNFKVYGLQKSVSEYVFARNLELLGDNLSNHRFTNQDPAAAAQAMQGRQPSHRAIMVWNPFALQVLNDNKAARVLFDSSTIPEEIIDMVVVAEDALRRPGGREFACAVIDTFYSFNRMLEDPVQKDRLLVALGEKFSRLRLDEMRLAVQQSRFYKTTEEGLRLFTGVNMPKTMQRVSDFCLQEGIIKRAPTLGYGSVEKSPGVQLRFDPSYMELVRDRNSQP